MKSRAITVEHEHYKVLASILNDFGEGRRVFTYWQLAKALKALGFGGLGETAVIPPRRIGRKVLQFVNDGGRMDSVVSSEAQDALKVALYVRYGWTTDTFRCRIKLPAHAT
ncbi:hypothetical protein LXA43DRAFT_1064521 [Ganoderma leucocontextum]|nr:hypothetical protein LXA43DRAFT_1066273 [Ganoderma leucocontextum]KAI1787172.1 hypothetical protein LXA43DRAFT_1064521 [Ganoderma leucocontextum]